MNQVMSSATRLRARENMDASPTGSLPLGTAAWLQFPEGTRLTFEIGQFWIGRLPAGDPVGFRDDRHVLVASGTRAGKGASIIVPNLCLWPGSVVVVDPKGENAMVSARRRNGGSPYCSGMGQKVRILDPFGAVRTTIDDFIDLKVAFNPLDAIKPDAPEAVDQASRIADALIVVENSSDPFWEESAKTLLRALILHVASSKDVAAAERHLITVRQMLMRGDAETRKLMALNLPADEVPSGLSLLFRQMKRNQAFRGVVGNAGEMFGGMLSNAPRLLGSIIQVACTNTDFLDSPAMQRVLGHSDFSLDELKTDRKGTSLFLCLPQRFMETHYRWLRMMVTLTVTEMERARHHPASGHPVLMVLDEFPALRRMRVLENAAAQIAGFGVKMVFVVQTLAQLKELYRDNWETVVANAGVKLFFGNDDHFTREYVSRLVGECEVVRMTRTQGSTLGQSSSTATTITHGSSSSNAAGTSSGAKGGSSQSMTRTHGSSSSMAVANTQGTSRSTNEGTSETIHKRQLITPDEVGRLFGDRHDPAALALISGLQPLLLKRTSYFEDAAFGSYYDRHPDHPPPPTLRLRKQQKQIEREEERQREQEQLRRAQRAHQLEMARAAQAAALLAARERQLAERARYAADEEARRKAADERFTQMWMRTNVLILVLLASGSMMAVTASRFGWTAMMFSALPLLALRYGHATVQRQGATLRA